MEEIVYKDEYLYKDIYTIINMMNSDMKSKISKQLIDFLEKNQDNTYISYINPNKPLKEQELNKKTKLFLSIIYINYFCEDKKREEILKKEKENLENANKNLYNNIFKNQNNKNELLKNKIEKKKKINIKMKQKN